MSAVWPTPSVLYPHVLPVTPPPKGQRERRNCVCLDAGFFHFLVSHGGGVSCRLTPVWALTADKREKKLRPDSYRPEGVSSLVNPLWWRRYSGPTVNVDGQNFSRVGPPCRNMRGGRWDTHRLASIGLWPAAFGCISFPTSCEGKEIEQMARNRILSQLLERILFCHLVLSSEDDWKGITILAATGTKGKRTLLPELVFLSLVSFTRVNISLLEKEMFGPS